jgi:ABC-2 type transport system ATP-binding protein
MLSCRNVSIRYRIGDFKNIGFKEWVMRRLTGRYEVVDFWADKDVSFEICEGDMLGIIGTNGAGKSTLLKAVSGIMEPTKGRIIRNGRVSALLELASGFDGDLTVRENAYLRGAMLGYNRAFMDKTYPYIIEFSELKSFEDRPFKQLSSGMKSRLAFAIASLVKPEILILDEVLSVGDGAFRAKSEAKMREIIKGGATTILVSHVIAQVRAMCNKVLWLHKGRQIAFTDDVVGVCDCYEEFLRGVSPAVYDPVAAKARINARAAAKARRETEARQMKTDAEKLRKVREILRRSKGSGK